MNRSDALNLAAIAVISVWYFNNFGNPNNIFFNWFDNFQLICWILSGVQWSLVLVSGYLRRNSLTGFAESIALNNVLEYGFCWMMSNQKSFDLYPFFPSVKFSAFETPFVIALIIGVSGLVYESAQKVVIK